MSHTTIIGHSGTRRRYRQGRGSQYHVMTTTWQRTEDGKIQEFPVKSAELGKKHLLPHLREISVNILMDVMEGKTLDNP